MRRFGYSAFQLVGNDLVDRGAYNRTDRRFERKHDYVFDRGILFNSFAASF